MNDKELLELAAKAAVLKWVIMNGWVGDIVKRRDYHGDSSGLFDPLNDDGDSFRLAIYLKLSVEVSNNLGHVSVWSPNVEIGGFVEMLEDDCFAATRRAITRCAAEIGRIM